MSRQDIVDICIASAIEEANKETCCLNCQFSYFSQYQEIGHCHNSNMVKGHIHPKVVSEFFKCPYWEKKIAKKEV